jgi:acid phosphatase
MEDQEKRRARRPVRVRLTLVAGAAVIAAGGLVAGGLVGTATAQDPPRTAKRIPNLTDVKNEIKAYYDSGNAAREQQRVADGALRHLRARVGHGVRKPAITLDVDDTVLSTYTYELTEDFGYDPETNTEWSVDAKFPGIPATKKVVTWAHDHGVKVFYITGRREGEPMRDGTLKNLANAGLPTPDHLYLRPVDDKDPSAVPYKSAVRKKLWKGGYRIVGNFGDQWSDLRGGWSERSYKLPNPMYWLP